MADLPAGLQAAVVSYLEANLDAYLDDLQALVSLDSYSYEADDVNRVVAWLERRLGPMGFEVERFPAHERGDNLRATRRGRGTRRVMLLGHSDTVFPRGTAAQRPMRFAGDKILGPGTCDMKSGLLAGIYAAAALAEAGFDDYGELIFLAVSDEEIDPRQSIPLIRETSRHADAVLTLEAARENGDIVVARKGVRSFTAEAFGRAAHAGVEPEKGHNAIVALARQVDALDRLNDRERGISVNVGAIEGGRLRNVVPDYAAIRFEARAFDWGNLKAVTANIEHIFQREPVSGVTFRLTWLEASPPMPRTAEIATLEAMAVQIARGLGFETRGARTGGTGDVAFVVDEGVPALDGLGPVGGLDHSPDEYIVRSSIVPRTALLALLIAAICGQG